MDIIDYNRRAWERAVATGNRWTVPVTPEAIKKARAGDVEVVLTPTRRVPAEWLGTLAGRDVLGLASAGGQQMPLFAAAGARVTSFDLTAGQLGRDREVAAREGLSIRTVEGDMRDLSAFTDASFDLLFHPVSNCFCPELGPVWREAFRVLRPGGVLLAGFANPVAFLLDPDEEDAGRAVLKYTIPYSDVTSLNDAERARWTDAGEPLCFGHSLEDQIGGQLAAGFALTGLFEDYYGETGEEGADALMDRHLPAWIATRALKMG